MRSSLTSATVMWRSNSARMSSTSHSPVNLKQAIHISTLFHVQSKKSWTSFYMKFELAQLTKAKCRRKISQSRWWPCGL